MKLAIRLSLDGVYIPSFNKGVIHKKFIKNNFWIIGSAHNLKEICEKRKQGVQFLFISPLFKIKKRKQFLGPVKFNILTKHFNKKTIALGGVATGNINAQLAARQTGMVKETGKTPIATAIPPKTGKNVAVVVTFEVISVRKIIKVATANIRIKSGTF